MFSQVYLENIFYSLQLIVCFKVFNALIARTARDNKLDVNDRRGIFPQADIRVGLIPAGSTDCVAMCLHGNNDPVTAALHIALGRYFPDPPF